MQITSGIKYRLHPDEHQAELLSQWIGCQRFIYNAKVGEDRYFRTFLKKALTLTGDESPVDQKYSQFISEETAFLRKVPSQILRNGAYRWMTGYQRCFKKLGGRPTFRSKNGRQSVLITSELFSINTEKGIVVLGTDKHPLGVSAILCMETEISLFLRVSVSPGMPESGGCPLISPRSRKSKKNCFLKLS